MALQTGTLTSTTPFPQAVSFPTSYGGLTLILTSAAAGRLIQISADGGITYFTPALDYSSATQVVVAITSPITNVQFTGQSGDVWGIL